MLVVDVLSMDGPCSCKKCHYVLRNRFLDVLEQLEAVSEFFPCLKARPRQLQSFPLSIALSASPTVTIVNASEELCEEFILSNLS